MAHRTSQTLVSTAGELMQKFAKHSGLSSTNSTLPAAETEPTSSRYLWTDSYAVCNVLALGQPEQARALVIKVHQTLARERPPKGSDYGQEPGKYLDAASDDHPTLGGLRIGKKMDERKADERFDERLEWDRDGQYFHYLTKWMFALDCVSRSLGDPKFNLWARELADVAHRRFVYRTSGGQMRMYWKMSVDLTRPLVLSMGHHDPLDGLITALQLQESATQLGSASGGPDLTAAVADYHSMIQDRDWSTTDPLGLGGLLWDACRVRQLIKRGRSIISHQENLRDSTTTSVLQQLLTCCLTGLQGYGAEFDANESAKSRLAFRELGLVIGLSAVKHLQAGEGNEGDAIQKPLLEKIVVFHPLAQQIEEFWLDGKNQAMKSYTDHQDINDVMLATCLLQDGFSSLI